MLLTFHASSLSFDSELIVSKLSSSAPNIIEEAPAQHEEAVTQHEEAVIQHEEVPKETKESLPVKENVTADDGKTPSWGYAQLVVADPFILKKVSC